MTRKKPTPGDGPRQTSLMLPLSGGKDMAEVAVLGGNFQEPDGTDWRQSVYDKLIAEGYAAGKNGA